MSAKEDVQDEYGDSASEYWPGDTQPSLARGSRTDIWTGPQLDEIDLLAHDLRNPLAAIALEATLAGERLEHADHDAMRRGLHRIQRNTEYLARMVEDLLDLGAFDHGHLRMRQRATELRKLLEQVIERTSLAHDCGQLVLDAPQPITTTIDPVRIERVVANLLQNALKYAPGRTTVVSLALVRGCARVSVDDEGPGIDPAEHATIFERYQRGRAAGATDGSGLGLYVSRCIVEAHGGHIGVAAERGQGSSFYFELPLR
ncbi:MAG TPA: HAMP domain-containing sensor histidine kinase [Polyangiales bacterium]|jgi:signal transduction histidine kinase|nr:HAMP domain-containing sensor histidine kinase [Polyangiales bacterium]